jgi:hypothetical protein
MALHLSDALASDESIEKIKKNADWFPAAITNCFCFELDLAETSSNVDFAFLCNRSSTGAKIIAGLSEIKLHDELFIRSVWAELRDFCRIWESAREIQDAITHLWIELDSNQYEQIPLPCIFFGMPRDHRTDIEWLLPLLETLNHPTSSRLCEFLQRCFSHRVLTNKRISLGLMFSRETNQTRLVFHRIDHDIFDLLTDPSFENISDLKLLMKDLLNMEVHLNLSVDVGELIGSRVGLECQFNDDVRKDQSSWNALLEYLVSLGCCAVDKKDSLLRWPGGSVERFHHLLMPVAVIRKIKHMKIVHQPGFPIQAKAYLFSIFKT